jgi:hypothetical protein
MYVVASHHPSVTCHASHVGCSHQHPRAWSSAGLVSSEQCCSHLAACKARRVPRHNQRVHTPASVQPRITQCCAYVYATCREARTTKCLSRQQQQQQQQQQLAPQAGRSRTAHLTSTTDLERLACQLCTHASTFPRMGKCRQSLFSVILSYLYTKNGSFMCLPACMHACMHSYRFADTYQQPVAAASPAPCPRSTTQLATDLLLTPHDAAKEGEEDVYCAAAGAQRLCGSGCGGVHVSRTSVSGSETRALPRRAC